MTEIKPTDGEKRYWLDDRHNVDKLYWLLVAICALVVISEAFFHKHTEFDFESLPGFYAAFGFGAFVFIVLAAKQLRKLLKRDEDFYDPPGAGD